MFSDHNLGRLDAFRVQFGAGHGSRTDPGQADQLGEGGRGGNGKLLIRASHRITLKVGETEIIALAQERGRKAVSATKAKVLYSAASDRFFGKSVKESKPIPFVSSAFNAVKSSVVSTITSRATDAITAEAGRLSG